MRLVKIIAPKGNAEWIAEIAFQAGIKQVSFHQEVTHQASGQKEAKEVIDLSVSTPEAKGFLDKLTAAPSFDPTNYSISVRQPRSLISSEEAEEVTWPIVEPSFDLYEELWQFSHITYSFIGRVFIAGSLVAYGVIEGKMLILISGLLFIPFLPLLLAIAFGIRVREQRIAIRGALAFLLGVILLFGAGTCVAAMIDRPLSFNESNPLWVNLCISIGIGIAATLAMGDDVGKREIIGLAASAQLGIIPVWLGVALINGYPSMSSPQVKERGLTLVLNVAVIIGASFLSFILLRVRGEGIRRLRTGGN
jgi:hypothetical protein